MTKDDLIDAVGTASDLTKNEARVAVETIFDAIADALAKGDKVELRGFGSFRIRQRQPRDARNPKIGTPVLVPAKRVPFFKAGLAVKTLLKPADQESRAVDMVSRGKPLSSPRVQLPSASAPTLADRAP